MKPRRYNVVVPRKYEVKGEEKTAWGIVGTLVQFPASEGKEEGFILELNMFPATSFKVFPQEKKEERETKNNDW